MPGRGRGRGRGGRGSGRGRSNSRGRGRGRGGSRSWRGGREGGANSGGNSRETAPTQQVYDINTDPQALFTGTATTAQHLEAQQTNRTRYAAVLAVLIKSKVQITQNARIRALAMAWARGDTELAKTLLQLRSQFGLVEVLRAISMLDAGRQMRVLEKRMKCLQLSGNKVSPQKIGKLKSDIDNLRRIKPPIGTASGSVCKQVAAWVRGFTSEELEFCAIHFPKDPWKKLADICHLNPTKDFPSASWFLPHCFGTASPPDGSSPALCQNVTSENVNSLVGECEIPYSVVKQYKQHLTPESKERIAEMEKLDTVLWYYEDLCCPQVDAVLLKRLRAKDPVNLPNGKLLERLMTILLLRRPELNQTYGNSQYQGEPEGEDNFFSLLIELAEPRLTSIRLSLESPVVVIGDASSSMCVAIRTSTIIASLLTSICSAELVFFNSENIEAPFVPKTVGEMLRLAVTMKACGSTSPAASLYPYYEAKKKVNTFIMVTDEEENTNSHGFLFTQLYKKYCEEVHPAYLVFVSFLRSQHAQGQMIKSLEAEGFSPKQLRLEGSRPDLTRLDDLFAQMSAVTTASFLEEVEGAESQVKTDGLKTLYDGITNAGMFSQDEE
ncbi:uncharacterized protein LOC101861104 [Aplysia californica]|uniref:Uncharacterized protein LOC101861104 n=1 Tax=Aplysia californica TaxID=6500 RepID=A0ABM0JGR9_APLCA|nr:uncharacterized protein LOC101861104 [Aplysia californica]